MTDIMGVAPWVVGSGIVSWVGGYFTFRSAEKRDVVAHEDRLEIHRDELTFDLLKHARAEMEGARLEMDGLRDELKKLRPLEETFFHLQQALDHLESILTAGTPEEIDAAHRSARAFLNRMRRLQQAKGTIRNEVQTKSSKIHLTERNIVAPEVDE